MSIWNKAKKLDDRVFGSSSSTRGFVFNAVSGLHPALAPVWFAVATLALLFAPIAFLTNSVAAGVAALLVAAFCAFSGYISRGLPERPKN